ncbi:MAG: GNAT family N-acetyltransferase [Anaerolineae bacterium]|nr:GNAT family N-acetyltransferase [Anaerolineae bacterium]
MTDSLPISFRRVTPDDKPRVLEICAGVWDGHDYVPSVLDAWLAADDADLIGVLAGDALVGFGHCVWMSSTYAWFEGLRIDSAWRNRGVARALHERMLAWAYGAGAARVGLSVYLDNQPSLRIVESHAFERVAGFVVLEAPAEGAPHARARAAEDVVRVSSVEAADYINRSAFLEQAHGFFPRNWRFYPYALGSEQPLAQMTHLLGLRRGGRLAALACIGAGEAAPTALALNFLDGSPDDMAILARHVLSLAGGAPVEAMAPAAGSNSNALLEVLSGLGFAPWNDFATDVFVYERPIAGRSEGALSSK